MLTALARKLATNFESALPREALHIMLDIYGTVHEATGYCASLC